MTKRDEHFEGVVYFTELNDEGLINYPKENILQVNVGDIVIFHITAGSRISKEASLRINLPEITSDNLYPKTAAFMESLRRRPSSPKLAIISENDERDPGLARIEPKERALGGTEFEVCFKYPGSFFYQVEYFDPSLNVMSNILFLYKQ